MLVVLDELKNMKASIKNDLSTYRRAMQALQNNQLDIGELTYVNELSMFLAQQQKIKEMLKEKLCAVSGIVLL